MHVIETKGCFLSFSHRSWFKTQNVFNIAICSLSSDTNSAEFFLSLWKIFICICGVCLGGGSLEHVFLKTFHIDLQRQTHLLFFIQFVHEQFDLFFVLRLQRVQLIS